MLAISTESVQRQMKLRDVMKRGTWSVADSGPPVVLEPRVFRGCVRHMAMCAPAFMMLREVHA